jgi:antitoxin VapB
LHERLERESHRARRGIDVEVRRIQERVARLPMLDPRPADQILGYDEHGLPR